MFGTDGVLLAQYAKVKKGEKVLDMGAGCGIVSLVLCGHYPIGEYTGIDLQPEMVDMANRSVQLNGLSNVRFVCADMKTFDGKCAYHVVVCNPPYERTHTGAQCENPHEALARYEIGVTLEEVVACAARALVPNGRFYLIHKAERLTELICLLHQYGVELKTIQPIQTKVDTPPRLLLLSAVKGGKAYLHWKAPLVLAPQRQEKE